MTSIAILSVNIGNYDYFWNGFYTSFERNFITDAAKDYYVFTDREKIAHSDEDNVHVIYQKDVGWPGDTLYRYRMFLSIREELEKYDYIFFFNSNSVLQKPISANDILPREGEKLTAVLHPSYYLSPSYNLPYERRRNSKAAIPYLSILGRYYFCGGINGGKAKDYLEMADVIDKWISIDDSNSITAIWHDESYLNRYLADNTKTVRVLSPSYAYPEQAFYNKDWKMPFECKLLLLDKQKYITISGSRMLKARESIWDKIERKIAVFLEPLKRRLWLGERTAARRSP